MGFKDVLFSDLDVFFNTEEFADEIIYVSQNTQTQYTIPAIIDFVGDPDIAGFKKAIYAEALIRLDQIPEPRNQDTCWIDGNEWRVEKLIESDYHVARLLIRRKESSVV